MPEVLDSILLSIKKLNNVAADYTAFDNDFIMWINGAFFDLNLLGVGPTEGFSIDGEDNEWSEYMDESSLRDGVKTYIGLHVRLFFDPPATSFTQTMMKDQLEEKGWKLKAAQEDLEQSPQKATLIFVVGDALRFRLRIVDPDPDWVDPDPDADPPNEPDMIPRDLTGWAVASQIRKSTKAADPVISEFEFNDLDDTGVIVAYLTHEESTKLEGLTSAVWDYQLTDPSGDPVTVMAGPAKPKGQVTR